MKFTTKVGDLLDAVNVAAKGAESGKSYVRALGCLEITAEQKEVRLVGTNMTTTVSVSMPLEDRSTKGRVLVPSSTLSGMLKVFERADSVEVSDTNSALRMEAGGAQIELDTVPLEDFPALAEIEGTWSEIDAGTFQDAFAVVEPSAGKDESRPVLTGVQVRSSDGKIKLAATDSFRLACCSFEAEGVPEFTQIIRADAISLALKLLKKDESLKICESTNPKDAADKRVFSFAFGNTIVTTRAIEGQYPDVDRLKPDQFSTTLVFDRKPFQEACRRLAKFAGKATAPARLIIGDDSIKATVDRHDVGRFNEIIPAEVTGDAGYEIGFNPTNLLEGVDAIKDDRLTFRLINPLRPGLITSIDESSWYLIMPIRLA